MRIAVDTIRSLQYFVRAVELGSLSAVAREHGTTQPTVSKTVAALEDSLGVRLLERSASTNAARPYWRTTPKPCPTRAAKRRRRPACCG
jgi:transposase-like protein